MEWKNGDYYLTDNIEMVDISRVHKMLIKTYWASERSIEAVEIAIKNSLCFSLFNNNRQIGFARAITDEAILSLICDVVIDEDYRGRGLGKWLMECVVNHPKIACTIQQLNTKDAHGLYEKYGFVEEKSMRKFPNKS